MGEKNTLMVVFLKIFSAKSNFKKNKNSVRGSKIKEGITGIVAELKILNKLYTIRGEKAMLDRNLADL